MKNIPENISIFKRSTNITHMQDLTSVQSKYYIYKAVDFSYELEWLFFNEFL